MKHTTSLAGAGFVTTAVAFGPARMGFGLFLPTFRENYDLSSTQAGLIASFAFFAFLVALPLAAWLDRNFGPRIPVVMGAFAAGAGLLLVAFSSNVFELATGVALAGCSAGFCWSPFNDAAERIASPDIRPMTLSSISTGATIGVAAAGIMFMGAYLGAFDWRLSWVVFGSVSFLAALMVYLSVPGGNMSSVRNNSDRPDFLTYHALPLYLMAAAFGLSNSVYISFAADYVVSAGGLTGLPGDTAAAVIFISYGLCGLAGIATGHVNARIGLYPLIGFIFIAFAASLVLIVLLPGSWAGVILSSGLHGLAVMAVSAALSFWSLQLFPGNGATAFTLALIAVAITSVIGSALAGVFAEMTNLTTVFLVTAIVPAATAVMFLGSTLYRKS